MVASVDNTFKRHVDKCTELADMETTTGKMSNEIRFINDVIQMQLLHNPDAGAVIKQMYTNQLLEIKTELTRKINYYISYLVFTSRSK